MSDLTAAELRQRIAELRGDGERFDRVNYFKRLWVGGYVGNADVIADCLEELLNQGVESVTPFSSRPVESARSA